MLLGDLLGTEMLAHGLGEERSAFHRGVVRDDHAWHVLHEAYPGHDSGSGHVPAIEAIGGERRELEKRAAGIEEQVDPVADRDLAPLPMPLDENRTATLQSLGQACSQGPGQGGPGGQVGREDRARNVDLGRKRIHGGSAASGERTY
jgi:hypothetical protein